VLCCFRGSTATHRSFNHLISRERGGKSQEKNSLTKKNPLFEFRVARSKDLIAVLVISSRLGSLEPSRSNCNKVRPYVKVNGSATRLVAHVIGSKQTEVGLGSVVRITTLKVVELGAVGEGIVSVLSRKSEDVGVIRSAGTCSSVREEEPRTASKEDINDWPEWSFTDKVFGDDRLIITIIHVGCEGCRGCMLAKVSIDEIERFTKTNRDPRCDNKTSVVSCGFCGL